MATTSAAMMPTENFLRLLQHLKDKLQPEDLDRAIGIMTGKGDTDTADDDMPSGPANTARWKREGASSVTAAMDARRRAAAMTSKAMAGYAARFPDAARIRQI